MKLTVAVIKQDVANRDALIAKAFAYLNAYAEKETNGKLSFDFKTITPGRIALDDWQAIGLAGATYPVCMLLYPLEQKPQAAFTWYTKVQKYQNIDGTVPIQFPCGSKYDREDTMPELMLHELLHAVSHLIGRPDGQESKPPHVHYYQGIPAYDEILEPARTYGAFLREITQTLAIDQERAQSRLRAFLGSLAGILAVIRAKLAR